MNVLYLSPGYPPEMQEYVRGLVEVGATVYGVGDGSPAPGLHAYLQVPRIMDEADVMARVHEWLKGISIDRVQTNWEPLVLLAARLRERYGIAGMSHDTVLGFRDKQLMKERIAAAGLRVPYSARARSAEDVRAAAEKIGFPLIIKPIAGAGSADTYRVNDESELHRVIDATRHVPEVSVEEFVEGEEFTYDTICIDGKPVFENVAQYLPRPLIARTREDIDPIICTVRDMYDPEYQDGINLGRKVLDALGMGTGFTHMEWYRKADGEVVFGEIGCRPGGARLVDQMNFTCDIDLFREWARAVCWKSFEADSTRKQCTAIVFKRAKGEGVITRVDGLSEYLQRRALAVCAVDLLEPGQHRRDWKQTLVSDGYVIVRHPDFTSAVKLAEEASRTIQLVC